MAHRKTVLTRTLDDLRPRLALIGGWGEPLHRWLLREAKRRQITTVLEWDAIQHRTLSAKLKAPLKRKFLQRYVDWAFVPGDPARRFARKLGVQNTLGGLYCCQTSHFLSIPSRRRDATDPFVFLYVGRLAPEKDLGMLIEAFRRASKVAKCPLELHMAGSGPEETTLRRRAGDGVEFLGFVQPSDLPAVYGRAHAFVLPSRFEPWGVVLLEAAASGLPLIATSAVGAAADLIRDASNGYVVGTGNTAELARVMVELCSSSPNDISAMGESSRVLSRAFDSSAWVQRIRFLLRASATT